MLKRFISEDPIGRAGGLNAYLYVGGRPTTSTDPRGLDNPGQGPYGDPWSTPDENQDGQLPQKSNTTGEPGFPTNQDTSCFVRNVARGAFIGGGIGFIAGGGKAVTTVIGACLGALGGAAYGDLTCPSDQNR